MSNHSIDLRYETRIAITDEHYRYNIKKGNDSVDLIIYVISIDNDIRKAAPINIKVPSDISYHIVLDYCFTDHYKLTDITALAELDASKVISMHRMFSYCNKLTDITPLSTWDVSNVKDMSRMFYKCTSLKNILALSDWTVLENCNIRRFYTIPEVSLEETYRYIFPEVNDIKTFIYNDKVESGDMSDWMEHTVPYRRMKYRNEYVKNNCPSWLVERYMKVHVFHKRLIMYDYKCNENKYRNEFGDWLFENYRDIIDYPIYKWYS